MPSATHEFVTSGYFGSIPGDPKGGKTRVVTNNDCNRGATNMGTPIYYMGTQENGGTFTDAAGKQEFDAPGEIGMLDWGACESRAEIFLSTATVARALPL